MNLRYNNLDNFNHYPENSQLLMVNHPQDGWTIQPKIEKEYVYIYICTYIKIFFVNLLKSNKTPSFFWKWWKNTQKNQQKLQYRLKNTQKSRWFTQGGHPHIFGPPHLCTNAAAKGW